LTKGLLPEGLRLRFARRFSGALVYPLPALILLTAIFRWNQVDGRETVPRVQSRRLLNSGVSGGNCAAHGKHIRFAAFLCCSVPVTLAQIVVAAVYVLALHYLV
jgi:hypothetical protein